MTAPQSSSSGSESALLPCPFCGEPPTVEMGGHVICCYNRKCAVNPEVRDDDADMAPKLWNKRPVGVAQTVTRCDTCGKKFEPDDDVVLMGSRGNYHQSCYLNRNAQTQVIENETDNRSAGLERKLNPTKSPSRAVVAGDAPPSSGHEVPETTAIIHAQPQPKWRHLKRGSIVTEIARGFAQVAHHPIEEMTCVVIYRHDEDGRYWVRNAVEFDDGRFEAYPVPSTVRGCGRGEHCVFPSCAGDDCAVTSTERV